MKKITIFILMTLLLLSGCSDNKTSNDTGNNGIEDVNGNSIPKKIKVSVSTYPMYYVAKEIGKDNIDLNILVPIGVDPHEYEISLKQTKQLEDTDLFLYNGSGLEHWGEKVSENMKSKDKRVINASNYVKLLDIEENHDEDHSDHEEDIHGDKDPHMWLDPTNVDKVAKQLSVELKDMDKENSGVYEKNYLELSAKLKALDDNYNEQLKNKKRNTILVSHRAFAYLAHRYNLEQIAVTGISPDSEPSPKSISKLIDITKEKNLKYIFFEVLSSPKSVEMIAQEANLEVLTLNPIGGITKDQFKDGVDYIDIMEENLSNLKKALVD